MASSTKLRELKAELSRKANHILAENGDKVWSKADQAEYDKCISDLESVNGQIAAFDKALQLESEEHFSDVGKYAYKNQPDFKRDSEAVKAARQGFEIYLRKRNTDFTAEERSAVMNVMSTTTGNQGGYTVQPIIASEMVDYLKAYGFMRRLASQITTASGVDMSWSTSDGMAETGEWIAQNTTATNADPTFGTVPLNVYKVGSKIITVPIELLQDSSIDVNVMVMKRLRDRIGRTANSGFTIGTGTTMPLGISVQAPVGKVGTTGQTLTVIYDDLVDLVDSLDAAYLPDITTPDHPMKPPGFMFSQTVRRVVRKIKDTAGRPIWTPSYDEGATASTPDRLLGYPVYLNNDMPVPAANAKSIAFGLFSEYVIRDAMDITIFRFDDSPYMSKGQVGFLAWARMGGNLLDVNAVKQYQHSAT